jgi:superfamily I DNA/RNA helicase/RecB family exonuclease
MAATYRLDTAPRALPSAPKLDESQRRVVEHPGGPLLVLAGPGTGKTTTLVESVVDRVERRGLRPDQILVLTFSRKAADDLRDRITARLGRTSQNPMSSTFHSFCYGVVRRYQPAELYAAPLRLLSAPEQDVMLRELLSARDAQAVSWPPSLAPALRTRGFAREVGAVLAHARSLGLDPHDLAAAGSMAKRPEWAAAAAFMSQYLDVLDSSSALDYAELVHRAVLLCSTDAVRHELHSQFRAVFVDEYQDTDASQVRLLQALAGGGRDLVAVGDPDQSIYAFRGADVRGILDFPDSFRSAEGRPADVVALRTTRRFGAQLLAASRRVAAGIGVRGAIDRHAFERFRAPEAQPGDYGDGDVEVFTFDSSGSEAAAIADLVRRAHLEDGVAWDQIAVLVRSGVTSLPFLRRALVAAGVPVEVAGDEVPLRLEPAVAPLLTALGCAASAEALLPDTAQSLLLSPLGGLDAASLRQLGRMLRARDRGANSGRLPRPSAELLRLALVDPGLLADLSSPAAVRARRLATLLAQARLQLAEGASAEEALWTLWAGTPWPQRLRAAVEHGGAAARSANRDLDAICALFELAARAEERRERAGASVFLQEVQAQQIPGDTLDDRGARGSAVRLLTAHRAKGLEWEMVVVASAQEGSWPDLRRRGSLLQPDRIIRDGQAPPVSRAALLAEERRLFYVAVTRARSRLIVTAVASPEPDGDEPSRFILTLGAPVRHRRGRLRRPLSVAALVGELRRTAADPGCSDALRAAAAARLARLAELEVADAPVAPFADPEAWWGTRSRSSSPVPLRAEDQPLRLTASTLSALQDCPLRWFLSRQAAGQATRSSALGFGSVIHVLVEHLGESGAAVDADELIGHLDSVWPQLQFDSSWIAARERAGAEDALRRFARWHNDRPDRRFLGAEVPFEVTATSPDGNEVVLAGTVDRLERDRSGRVVVVDFKTGKTLPTRRKVQDDVQLDFYQLATDAGAFSTVAGATRSGGAELVQLRADADGMPTVQRQPPPEARTDSSRPVDAALQTAGSVLLREQLVATGNAHCGRCEFVRQCPAAAGGGDPLR